MNVCLPFHANRPYKCYTLDRYRTEQQTNRRDSIENMLYYIEYLTESVIWIDAYMKNRLFFSFQIWLTLQKKWKHVWALMSDVLSPSTVKKKEKKEKKVNVGQTALRWHRGQSLNWTLNMFSLIMQTLSPISSYIRFLMWQQCVKAHGCYSNSWLAAPCSN